MDRSFLYELVPVHGRILSGIDQASFTDNRSLRRLGRDQSVSDLSADSTCSLVDHQPASPLWYGLYGFLPAAATAAIAWLKLYIERRDKKTDTVSELRDRLRSTMDAQSLAMYERLERENKRLTERLDELEADRAEIARDRDRGWYLARWWEGYAHEIKHRFANLLFRANGRLELAKLRPVQVPEIDWPGLEDPMPKPRENKPDV